MISFRMIRVHWDEAEVTVRSDRAIKSVLTKFGAYVFTTARQKTNKRGRAKKLSEMTKEERRKWHIASWYSRKRGGPPARKPHWNSKPGEPPCRITNVLRKNIRFGYDDKTKSVVIGPIPVPNKPGPAVLKSLEYGGMSPVATRSGNRKDKYVRARPYMVPSRDENLPKLPGMWQDAIR